MCKMHIYTDIIECYTLLRRYEGGMYMSPASKAQQKAVNKYMKENYDRINLLLPKGKKAVIQDYAASHGESVNGFINRAVDEAMARDKAE